MARGARVRAQGAVQAGLDAFMGGHWEAVLDGRRWDCEPGEFLSWSAGLVSGEGSAKGQRGLARPDLVWRGLEGFWGLVKCENVNDRRHRQGRGDPERVGGGLGSIYRGF